MCIGVGVLNGQLYAAGGHDGPLVRKSVEVFDLATNTWRQVCDMNMCRRNAGEQLQHIVIQIQTLWQGGLIGPRTALMRHWQKAG